MERKWNEKMEDKFDEVKLKTQAKAADFADDKSQQYAKEAQAKAKATSNNLKDTWEKQEKINKENI